MCHVCSTLIAADQKFQKNDIVFHQECYDQIQNDSAYESNKTVEESNVSEDLEPKIIEKSNKDPTPELHSENSISSSNSQKLITNTNQSIEQPIEQPTDQPPIESRDKIEVDRSTSESQIIESLDQFSISKEETKTIKDQKEDYYPEELNPFGSDDDDDEADDDPSDTKKIQQSNTNKFAIRIPKDEEYPDELNPFADDDDDEDVSPASTNCNHFKLNTTKASTIDDYDESLNPFANDEDDEEDVTEYASNSLSKPPPTAPRSSLQRIHQSNSALDYSPYSSIRSSSFDTRNTSTPNRSMTPNHGGKLPSNKKRAAPKPPTSISPSTSLTSSINLGDRLNACSQSNPVTPEISRKLSSLRSTSKLSCHSEFGPSSVTTSSAHTLHAAERSYDSLFDDHRPSSFKRSFESTCKQRLSLRDTSGSGTIPRCVKKKKAPPPPISVRRIVSCSAVEIIAEINEIGDKLSDNESSIKQIEETLQSHQNQTHDLTKGKIKKLIFEYLNLISVKCALAKRQEELMYMYVNHF